MVGGHAEESRDWVEAGDLKSPVSSSTIKGVQRSSRPTYERELRGD